MKAFGLVTGWVLFLGQNDSPSRGKSTWRNSRINSTWVSTKSIIKSIWKWKKDCQVIISPLLQFMLGFKQAIFPAGEDVSDWVADVKKGLNSLYVYFSWGTENGGRCPRTVIENRTSGRKRRRNDHPSVWSDTVLSTVTTTTSDNGNRYKGRHRVYIAIRKRKSGGDTAL